jgi:hypothetical protein
MENTKGLKDGKGSQDEEGKFWSRIVRGPPTTSFQVE